MGPFIVPDLADLLVGCRLVLNERKSSTEPACNATRQTQNNNTHEQYKIAVKTKPKRDEYGIIVYSIYICMVLV